MAHKFHFFRAGGVDQVSLRDGDDLRALSELDQKLWVALVMPVHGVDIDPETLALLDEDKDGRIHVDDILAAVKWVCATFKDPGDVLTSATEVRFDALASAEIVATAKRMLVDLGKTGASITFEDVAAITKVFIDTRLNGDGVVHPESTPDVELSKVIADGVASVGSLPDRSGKPGLDLARADDFFAEVDKRNAWLVRGKQIAPEALGAGTTAAADALVAVRAKVEDYFTRSKVAAFDPRGAAALGGSEADLLALYARSLGETDEELAKFPLARIDASGRLPLRMLNPAWSARMATFETAALLPILGMRDVLTAADLAAVTAKLAAYEAWRADRPATKVDALAEAWLEKLAAPELRAALTRLIADDKALEVEYEHLAAVGRVVRFRRDFGRVLRNFVNFSDFYARHDGAFQVGRLYFDARELRLCMLVSDAARHAALDGTSDAYLVYLDTTREGKTVPIVAALTNGDADNVFVGRNGLYYDRKGDDWDATVTKIITNPISIREAFWAPYKKVVKVIEDQVAKRAAKADAEANAKLEEGAKTAVNEPGAEGAAKPGAPAAAPAAAAAPPAEEKESKIDLGTVAAIGVALGGIGTLFGTLLGVMFGLGAWLPVGLLALLLMISGPSMLLAWLKLRRRNIGPLLDANGWAINSRAKINVPFGATMTELPVLPKGSERSTNDPYADKSRPWKTYFVILVAIVLGVAYYLGKLDRWVPLRAKSVTVLGENAPAWDEYQKEQAALAKVAAEPAKPGEPVKAPEALKPAEAAKAPEPAKK